jgi:hypothetical protein
VDPQRLHRAEQLEGQSSEASPALASRLVAEENQLAGLEEHEVKATTSTTAGSLLPEMASR